MRKSKIMKDFDYYIDEYMYYCRSRKLRPKTMNSYEQTLRLFERWCEEEDGIKEPSEVREATIRKYICDLQERGKYTLYSNDSMKKTNFPERRKDYRHEISTTTINNYIRNIKAFYTWFSYETREDNIVRIERIYKELIEERILDVKLTGISLVGLDEVFVRLINHKDAWASNYGRVLEYHNNRYRFKRLSENEAGEKVCTLSKNVYNGKKWVWKKQTVEVWRLVVEAFIVNFDIAGNTHCWHKNDNKADNYYRNIYPMNEKQYNAVLDKYNAGVEITDELIEDIVNDILYKADDWYANKWRRTLFGVGYLGCCDAEAERDNYIYSKWRNMIQRCYDENTHKLKPYYASCTTSIEWQNFSNYRIWHKENQMGDQKLDLDKDVMIQGNMEYGAETCTLIPHFTNTVFEERGADTNITLNNDTGKYDVVMSILGKKKEVGAFDTEEEARAGFIAYKQDYIRKVAEDCKGKVPNKTYEAMKNWTVELNDTRKAAA